MGIDIRIDARPLKELDWETQSKGCRYFILNRNQDPRQVAFITDITKLLLNVDDIGIGFSIFLNLQ